MSDERTDRDEAAGGSDRRTFLKRSGALLGAGTLGLGGLASQSAGADADAPGSGPQAELAFTSAQLAESEPFEGVHQGGILTPRQAHATFAALDSVAPDRGTLRLALEALSERTRELVAGGSIPELTSGKSPEVLDPGSPPMDSGILGPVNSPDGLTVTISFGASLFDSRYGLAGARPKELVTMPTFAIDELDPERSHGDVLLQICAHQQDTVTHTLRELLRTVRGTLVPRWTIDGFQSAARGPSPHNNARNLFAFRDGSANPPTDDAQLMNRLIWLPQGQPAWATGGTYQVVRTIRMHVEFWDRVGMTEQEQMIGRSRSSGAPLGGTDEFEDPRYDLDPKGERIPMTAHIRTANPRTPATEDQRILRRGYNYMRGIDAAGTLDQGLVFVAFNQSPRRQFQTIQERLIDEPMIDYITPVGGGYFFAPPGAGPEPDFVGSGLFSS
jgi:deferrochelatase/peroxidase EfeB